MNRFLAELNDQLLLLDLACRSFDGGSRVAALQMSATLRVLLRDTRRMTSLLSHLGATNVHLLSTGGRPVPPPGSGVTAIEGGLVVIHLGAETGIHPVLGDYWTSTYLPIAEWLGQWISGISTDPLTRERLVLLTADKGGGTHIDATLPPVLASLREGHFSPAWVDEETAAEMKRGLENHHYPLLRQLAYEVLHSPELISLLPETYRPDWVNRYAQAAIAARSRGEWRAAVREFDMMLVLDPNHVGAATDRGLALGHLKDFAGAAEALENARVLARGQPAIGTTIARHLGLAYSLQKDRQRAWKSYEEGLELTPEDPALLLDMGVLAYDQGDRSKAESLIRRATAAGPTSARAYHMLGWMLLVDGRLDEAESACMKAIEIEANNGEVWYTLGQTRGKAGNRDGAIAAFEEAFRLDPKMRERARADGVIK